MEIFTRKTKEGTRFLINDVSFRRVPKFLVKRLVESTTRDLSLLPAEDGESRSLSYPVHCHMRPSTGTKVRPTDFGKHEQADIDPRTRLGTLATQKLGQICMHLVTGKLLRRKK